MSQDQQTYTRATTAALLGFATQLLLFLLVLIVGLYTDSKAVLATAFFVFPGLLIWVLLWVLYRQHKLERDETLQTAQLADSDARSAALFEEAGGQLAQAKTRLENLYKWALPIVSMVVAVYLLGVGTLLLYLNNRALQNGSLEASPFSESANISLVGLLLLLGWLGGFLVARYVSGMTRVDAWQALRGGASTLIGNVFLGILPLIGAGVPFYFGNNTGFVYLALILPVVMILLGIEIVLGQVLGFYRPRKGDQFVRPAFDSRLLGWLTRPESIGKIFSETLNYQFGFEVSKSWFMRLLGKALLPLAAACVAVIIGISSLVIVQPQQQAVVTLNGAFVRVAEPGLSLKAPWPFGAAEKYDVQRIHTLRMGSKSHIDDDHLIDGPILWTNQHVEDGQTERLLVSAPPPGVGTTGQKDSILGEQIGADIDVNYRITDLKRYAGVRSDDNADKLGMSDPKHLLNTVAEHEITRYFATHDTDTLLASGREVAGAELQAAIQARLDEYAVGLEVVYVSVSGIHPPQDVADDYHARINAIQESQTEVEKALQEADVVLAQAAGDEARATRLSELIDTYYKTDAKLKALSESESVEVGSADKAQLQRLLESQRAAIELLMIESGGQVGQRLAEARATRWSTSLSAEARALRLGAEITAFENAPRYYPVSRYLDTLITALADRPKTIIGPEPDADKPNVVLDLPLGGVPGLGQ